MADLPDGAALGAARIANLEKLCRATGGWTGGTPEARAFVSGLAMTDMNGVWAMERGATSDAIADGLARVAARGVPHTIQARPACHDAAAAAAATAGLTQAPTSEPVMALVRCAPTPPVTGLRITTVGAETIGAFRSVLQDVFDMPPELTEVFHRVFLPDPEARLYVGEVDGVAVATAATSIDDGAAGVFAVSTSEAHRGRGYGGAVTAHAVRAALAAGARFAWLRSTDQGLRVYERIGFTTLEHWSCWRSG